MMTISLKNKPVCTRKYYSYFVFCFFLCFSFFPKSNFSICELIHETNCQNVPIMEGFVNHKLEKWDWGLSSRILFLPTKNETKPMTLVEKFANTTRKRKTINMAAVLLGFWTKSMVFCGSSTHKLKRAIRYSELRLNEVDQ